MIAALFLLLGGAWRFIDGLSRESTGIPTGFRNAVAVAIAISAACSAGLGWWSLWAGAVAAASVIIGETRWESWTWQAIRFGGLAAVAVLPVGLPALPYVVACALGGLCYPALALVEDRLPRWGWFDGFEAYARVPLGAVVLGGLAFL